MKHYFRKNDFRSKARAGFEPVRARWREYLLALGVPVESPPQLPGTKHRRGMVLVPIRAAEIIRAYIDAKEKRPGATKELAGLTELTVARLAADAWKATRLVVTETSGDATIVSYITSPHGTTYRIEPKGPKEDDA